MAGHVVLVHRIEVRVLEGEHMKDTVLKYINGQPLTLEEAVNIIKEYMTENGHTDFSIIDKMLNGMNPFGQGLLQKALDVSIHYLTGTKYCITRVSSKDGNFIYAF
jgi:hypothetical protein